MPSTSGRYGKHQNLAQHACRPGVATLVHSTLNDIGHVFMSTQKCTHRKHVTLTKLQRMVGSKASLIDESVFRSVRLSFEDVIHCSKHETKYKCCHRTEEWTAYACMDVTGCLHGHANNIL